MNEQSLAVKDRTDVAQAEQPMNGNKSLVRGIGLQAPLSMNELKFFGSMIHEAGLIPKMNNESPRQLEARAMAKVIAGHAYGFDPILSMRLFDVINGKLQPTSECVSVLIKRSGRYNYKVVTWNTTTCDLLFVGKASDGSWKPLGHSIFTIDDAKRAGYTTGPNKNNWEKIPRNMLLARAITNGKRLFCADVMDPAGYFGQSGNEVTESADAPDDLEYIDVPQLSNGELVDTETGEVVENFTAPEVTADAPPPDVDPIDEELSRLIDLRDSVSESLRSLPASRQKDLQAGRTPVSKASWDELIAYQAAIQAEA